MKIKFKVETVKKVKIKVPSELYRWFLYDIEVSDYDYEETNIHYNINHLEQLIDDIEDDEDMNDKQKNFIYEVYKLCEKLFNENDLVEIHFFK